MGVPLLRLEVTTFIDGVEFADWFRRPVEIMVDGILVS